MSGLTDRQVFGTMAGIWMFVIASAIPLYIWGERVRNYTINNLKVILFDKEHGN
jgi:hypothetical protein